MGNLFKYILMAVLLGASFATVVCAETSPAPKRVVHVKHSSNPAIHSAILKLRRAKRELEKSAADANGHKRKAMDAIDVALKELRAFLDRAK